MTRRLALVLLLTAVPCLARAAEDPLCPTVVPGKSIGPLALGMAPAAVAKLKLPKGLYELYPSDGSKPLTGIGLELLKAKCLVVGGKKIPARLTAEAIALQLGGCGPAEQRKGGNWLSCQDGKIALGWNLMTRSVRVQGGGEKTALVCDGYVVPGSHVVSAREGERLAEPGPAALPVDVSTKYCWWDRVITGKWKPADIWKIPGRSCSERKAGRLATTISCDYWASASSSRGACSASRSIRRRSDGEVTRPVRLEGVLAVW